MEINGLWSRVGLPDDYRVWLPNGYLLDLRLWVESNSISNVVLDYTRKHSRRIVPRCGFSSPVSVPALSERPNKSRAFHLTSDWVENPFVRPDLLYVRLGSQAF